MKKVLLGTTALVAASLVAGAAAADEMTDEETMAEPISVSLNGHHRFALAMLSGDDGRGQPLASVHGNSLLQDTQLRVSGATTLDSGMTVAVTAIVDSTSAEDTGNLQLDERYTTVSGSFGRVQLGSVESARQQVHQWAPSATGNFGINSPYFTAAPEGGWLGRFDDAIGHEDAARIVYFTPTVGGFTVGLSYAPDDSGRGQYGGNSSDDAGAPHFFFDTGEYQNHIGFGVTFTRAFAGGSVTVAGAYETYEAELADGMTCDDAGPMVDAAGMMFETVIRPNCEPATFDVGLSLSVGDFSFGGGMRESDSTANTKVSITDFGVGWSSGPMSAALMWGEATYDGPGTVEGAATSIFGINGSYALGPGVAVEAQIDTGSFDYFGPADPAFDFGWVQMMVGTAIAF